MNYEKVTLQDCIDMYAYKDRTAILNDGKMMGFCKEGGTREKE